jgi:hypothetical protein
MTARPSAAAKGELSPERTGLPTPPRYVRRHRHGVADSRSGPLPGQVIHRRFPKSRTFGQHNFCTDGKHLANDNRVPRQSLAFARFVLF